MTDRNKIVDFCAEFLQVKDFQDYCHNGLQVEGAARVEKIISGVSLSRQLLEKAVAEKAQLVLVHHGLFGDQLGQPPRISGFLKERLRLLLQNDINLLGYHLPLDAQPEIGNNISLCRLFGIQQTEKMDIGFCGNLPKPLAREDFLALIEEKLNTSIFAVKAGSEQVRRVGVISGGSSPEFMLAKEYGCDTFVCGDIREGIVRAAEEIGINLVNAGHYNTEKEGVRNLGELIAQKFGIQAVFIDIPCAV